MPATLLADEASDPVLIVRQERGTPISTWHKRAQAHVSGDAELATAAHTGATGGARDLRRVYALLAHASRLRFTAEFVAVRVPWKVRGTEAAELSKRWRTACYASRQRPP